jgi:hypothetical protein
MANFKWTGRSTVTRSKDGSAGISLEPDHIYDVAAFGEAVVEEWIRTGHAEPIEVKANDTALAVKSHVVKVKSPKVG